MREGGKTNFWDKIAGVYDIAESFNGEVYGKMTRLVTKLTPEGALVLDCAAGTGELSLAAAKKAKKVICTDYSRKMLRQAEKKAETRGIKNICFDARDIYRLKDCDESYDTVIAGNVLHLLSEPEKVVKELYRVTKRGGRILLPTFVTGEKNLLSIKLYKLIGFKPEKEYTAYEYAKMLSSCNAGRMRARLIDGRIPCCFAVIYK